MNTTTGHVAQTVFIRLPEVLRRCGLSRSSVYFLIAEGRFPTPIKIAGARAAGWIEAEIEAWLQASIEASRAPKQSDGRR